MSYFDMSALLLGLAALFGYANHRLLRLPPTIGLLVIALGASFAVILLDLVVPGLRVGLTVTAALGAIDFQDTLMNGMLSFLLFAAALHVDFSALASRKYAISLMATAGVLCSTLIVGTAMWYLLARLGTPIGYPMALVFGALISPTDPVAVLGILKTVRVPPSLEAKIAGESLFNDGVGVVVFTILVVIATGAPGEGVGPLDVLVLFLREAVGGAALGLAAGYVAFRAMRSIDEHNLEVIITLALVTVAYAVAQRLEMSGPIAVVVAGLLIGNHGMRYAMSETTRDHVQKFWSLSDEILNSVLFLLIGLEVLVVGFDAANLWPALAAIPVVLGARLISVSIPLAALSIRRTFTRGAIPVLTWGGLRGGISVALALSLPESESRGLILVMTYAVVIFSIVVQGLTVKAVVARAIR